MCRLRMPRAMARGAIAAIGAALLAGCASGQSGPATAGTGPAPVMASGVAPGGGTVGYLPPYSARRLSTALLASVDGAGPVAPVQVGAYGALQGVRAMRATLPGVRVIPARCARAARTGLGSAALAGAPATVASFRVGSAGVSEVLLAPPTYLAWRALGPPVPAGCAHYRAVVGGRVFAYTVREVRAPNLGVAAREVNVHAVGAMSIDVWTVIYRAAGYIGAVTVVGPAATRAGAEAIARAAYARARLRLG